MRQRERDKEREKIKRERERERERDAQRQKAKDREGEKEEEEERGVLWFSVKNQIEKGGGREGERIERIQGGLGRGVAGAVRQNL